MKKLLLTTLSILACGAAYALPVGNPSEASLLCDGMFWEGSCCIDMCDPCISWCDALSFRLGYYGDFVFDRNLEVDSSASSATMQRVRINTNAGYMALNAWDRVDLFVNLGATNISVDANAKEMGHPAGQLTPTDANFHLSTETDWSWGVGLRATILECGCTSFGAVANYFQTRPSIDHITVGAEESVWPSNNVDYKYREWQIAVGISHRINLLVPYLALKWSRSHSNLGDASYSTASTPSDGVTVSLPDLDQQKIFGLVIGTSLVDCEKAAITAEARFIDETALYINGQFRF